MKIENNKIIQITVLGGGREIGANCYLLKWGEKNILLDAGQNPNAELADALVPVHKIPDNLDAIIITHGHLDHIGSTPFIWKKRHPKKIITQKYSLPIIERMARNTASYMQRFDTVSQKYAYSNAYYYKSLIKLFKLMKETSYPYLHEFNVTKNISGYFFDAGHILGSAGIVLTDGDYTFLYTGDIAVHDHGVHSGMKLPNVESLDCLLVESTTSSEKKHIVEEEQWQSFFNDINDAYVRKSRVLIPAFALGRSQDIMALIEYGKQKNLIAPDIPVFLTGLGNAITDIYEKHKKQLRSELLPNSFFTMFQTLDFDKLINEYYYYLNQKKTAIFICTNGMMNPGTPAAVLGTIMANDPNETILFSGFQSPATLGFEVMNASVGDVIDFGENSEHFVQIKTPYRSQVRMSGHGSKNDMLKIAHHLNPKNIAVIHGEESSVDNLVSLLSDTTEKVVLGPKTGETLLLRTPGNKTMRSKSDIKAQIITVGTSLLGSYFRKYGNNTSPSVEDLTGYILEQAGEERACSAEVQTLDGLNIDRGDYLYFISSGDDVGIKCGDALSAAYRELGYFSKNLTITHLTKNYDEFKNIGLPQFINAVVDIIEEHDKNASIIATGGFKAETAFATMIGSLTKVPVNYIHEDFQSVVELPGLPVNLDFSAWTMYFNMVEFVLMQNKIKKAKKIIKNKMPEFMAILFTEDKDLNQMILTPIGELLKRLHTEYILTQNNIMTLNCGANRQHLWGNGRIKIKEIPGYELRLILNRFQMQSSFIREIRLGKIIEDKSDRVLIKFHHKGNDKLHYNVVTPAGGQELIIHTYPGVGDEFIKRVGKTLNV